MPRSRRVKTIATIFVLFSVLSAPMVSSASTSGSLSGALSGLLPGQDEGSGEPADQTLTTTSPSGSASSDDFRIGWYDALAAVEHPPLIAADGMSMITAYHGEGAQPLKYLDAAQASGTTVMAEIPDPLVRAVDIESVKNYVQFHKDHPALEGWHLADEPSVNRNEGPLTAPNAIKLYDAIKAVDPVHPVSITFASGEDPRPYVPAMDVLQHDDYPAKAFNREFTNLDRWTRFTSWMGYVARQNNKPFVPILQAFGGSNLRPVMGYRAPTAREMRYMVYASLAYQADSVYFWAFYRRDPSWVNSVLAPLVDQLHVLQPALEAGAQPGTVSSSNANVTTRAFQDPSTSRWYVLIVNHAAGASSGSATFSGPLAGNDVAYRDGQATPITNDQLGYSLSQYEARVYTID
jgi:hypothetical protein